MAVLVLKPGAERRLAAGHPWVYRGEVADVQGRFKPGDVVDVVDAARRRIGRGFYNPRPSLVCRLLAREGDRLDAGLFRERLRAALAFRRSAAAPAGAPFRLCWSEADGLPGLVADRYGPVTVIQCLTLGMARHAEWVLAALEDLFPGDPVFRGDDPTAARLEGFVPEHGWIGPAPREVALREGNGTAGLAVLVDEGSCRFEVEIGRGHKTGFYLDQRENRLLVGSHAAGRRVLDAFCYTGAFACHALRAGAIDALLVDTSAEALAGARRHLELNALEGRAEVREGNAFDVLRQLERSRARFGLVVLDPPPFTRSKDALPAAARGYKEINLRALRLLEPGGLLTTFSCSHHVSPAVFEEICREAAGDAGCPVRVRAVLSQSRDHPVLLNVPETRYLTGLLLERV